MDEHFPGTEWLRVRPGHRRRPRPLQARPWAHHLGRRRRRAARRGLGARRRGRPVTHDGVDLQRARQAADAVLYEGYLLYPYRATARKNQVRWQFGVLGPPGAAAAGAGEEADLAVQCLLRSPAPGAAVTVHLRFLQLQRRVAERADDGGWTPVDELRRRGRQLDQLGRGGARRARARAAGPGHAATPATRSRWPSRAASWWSRCPVGRLVRRRWPVRAAVALAVEDDGGFARLSVSVTNVGAADHRQGRRDQVVPDRGAPAAGGARRAVRLGDRPARGRARGGRPVRAAPLLAGPRRRRCTGRPDLRRRAGVADHPLRPSRGGAGERRCDVRLHRDRRDPHAAGDDADRRREGRGPRHRPALPPRSSTAASR